MTGANPAIQFDRAAPPDSLTGLLLRAAAEAWNETDIKKLRSALCIAEVAHKGQTRKHGTPYILHPLRVALALFQQGERDPVVICAALLHDTLEDAPDRVTKTSIANACGTSVAELVDILTSPRAPTKEEENQLKVEKVLRGPREAWRIKLADRLDNLGDALAVPGAKGRAFRARYLADTRTHYLPLAQKLGDPSMMRLMKEGVLALERKAMSEYMTPSIVSAVGLELDLSRMRLPANVDARYGSLLNDAARLMQSVEAGDHVNYTEDRQVGHLWLRNPSLAPAEYRQPIQDALTSIDRFHTEKFAGRFTGVLWVGIGGSGLGPQMLYCALRVPGSTPAMWFFDNTDPAGFRRTLREIEAAGGLEKILTVVVSKSGSTPESANGMQVAKQAYRQAGLEFKEFAVAITMPGSKLDKEAANWLASFPIWDWVGGRTSLFSAVGMLPARLLGFRSDELLEGARAMDDATRDRGLDENPALLLAATWYHAVETLGLKNMVMLPYCDGLQLFSRYLQQLVMESLGKAGKGITVFGNKGSTDQHSFVQQLREGQNDFFATFLSELNPGGDWALPSGEELPESGGDATCTVGDYLSAFLDGTSRALRDRDRLKRPSTLR